MRPRSLLPDGAAVVVPAVIVAVVRVYGVGKVKFSLGQQFGEDGVST